MTGRDNRGMRLLHITKTGGTALSDAVLEQLGVRWSYHDEDALTLARNGRDGLIGPLWHQPLDCFHIDFVKQHRWFVIVRDPIDRAVSEVNCNWEGFRRQHPGVEPTAGTINQWIRICAATSGATCHWHPQWRYAFPEYASPVEYFKHSDIKEVAEKVGLSGLPRANEPSDDSQFSRDDLTSATLAVLRDVYSLDFRLFGFDRRA